MEYAHSKLPERRFLLNGQPLKAEEVVRVVMLTPPVYERTGPESWAWTEEGEFEWRHMGECYTVDMITLKRDVETLPNFKGKSDEVLDRLLNFHKVFLVLPLGRTVVTG